MGYFETKIRQDSLLQGCLIEFRGIWVAKTWLENQTPLKRPLNQQMWPETCSSSHPHASSRSSVLRSPAKSSSWLNGKLSRNTKRPNGQGTGWPWEPPRLEEKFSQGPSGLHDRRVRQEGPRATHALANHAALRAWQEQRTGHTNRSGRRGACLGSV